MYIPPFFNRKVFLDTIYFAWIVGCSVELIDGLKILWIALREPLPRPLCPVKFYNFGQTVKSLYERDLEWMKKDIAPTLHKVWDHPREVLERVPDTLRISMMNEEPLEGKQILRLETHNAVSLESVHNLNFSSGVRICLNLLQKLSKEPR